MKKVSVQIERIRGNLTIPIPDAIAEMMDWQEGDTLEIPFHEISKQKTERMAAAGEMEEEYKPEGKEEVIVEIKTYEPKKITQKDVIRILDNPTPEMKNYRTSYVSWKGERYGIKKVCAELFGFNDFNTIQGEKYLNELGFRTGRDKK